MNNINIIDFGNSGSGDMVAWIGIIATIIVTLFVTFNIFQFLDFKAKIKKIDDLQDDAKKRQVESEKYHQRSTAWIQLSMSWHYWYNKRDKEQAIKAIDLALRSFLILNEDQVSIDFCNGQKKDYQNNEPPKKTETN